MLKIGTRGSHLATTQAGHVRDALIAGGTEAELHIVTTAGDLNMSPVERIGVGVFTTALRDALASGEVDVAVHSFKDLPTAGDARLHLVTPEREDNREALIARDGLTLTQLPQGAKVGTSAPRRVSQLRSLRPDLDIRPLRGNIETRMSYVERGELDAIILAYAGLCRGGYAERATEVFDPATLMPAPAQGALAVECRAASAGHARGGLHRPGRGVRGTGGVRRADAPRWRLRRGRLRAAGGDVDRHRCRGAGARGRREAARARGRGHHGVRRGFGFRAASILRCNYHTSDCPGATGSHGEGAPCCAQPALSVLLRRGYCFAP